MSNAYLYTIYAEDVSPKKTEAVMQYLATRFEGFTTLRATGVWGDTLEKSLVVQVILPEPNRIKVRAVAETIREMLSQQEVLVTVTPVTLFSVRRRPA